MRKTAYPGRTMKLVWAMVLCGIATAASAADATSLRGIVVDDTAAKLVGDWVKSTSVRPYVGEGYIHDSGMNKGAMSARFELKVPSDGEYHVLVSYSHGGNRDKKVPVAIQAVEGSSTVYVDQSMKAAWSDGFHPLGTFCFTKAAGAVIVISNEGTKQVVIVDAVRLLAPADFELAKKESTQPVKVAAKADPKPAPTPVEQPKFTRVSPQRSVSKLTSAELDSLLREELPDLASAERTTDEDFLRRASLDLLGRPPTLEEFNQFTTDTSPSKRATLVEKLLASPEYGNNWANYWSDSIGARQQEPELTFHDYGLFKGWLAEQFNAQAGWDEMVFSMVASVGKVSENPASTFIGFHQANGHRLAGETTRVFLSRQIHCCECHDHPFIDMPQETFHGMAAFFVRTDAKIPQLKSDGIEVLSKDKGEQKIDGKKGEILPTNLAGETVELGSSDLERRTALAKWLVSGDNPDFARAYVNRIWARLLGRGFAEPVDELGEMSTIELPEVFDALADHFVATDFNHAALFSLIMNSEAYQRKLAPTTTKVPFASLQAKPLRGDEVFDSLVVAVELESITPPREAKSTAVRFPPPPKSTRDLINDAFGYDPSFDQSFILRTMKQAMFMMNNNQLDQAIQADDDTTFLAKLLQAEADDAVISQRLYRRVLARNPTESEQKILREHITSVNNRAEAFEDILWSLINSTEFTVRK